MYERMINIAWHHNRPFPSSLVPLFQSESKYETILIKMTFICEKMKLRAELIFIDSVWNRGTRELGNGLLSSYYYFLNTLACRVCYGRVNGSVSEWVRDVFMSHQSDWTYYKQPIKFPFLATRGNLTLVFHKGVNSISTDESSSLVPTRCLLFFVTNGN